MVLSSPVVIMVEVPVSNLAGESTVVIISEDEEVALRTVSTTEAVTTTTVGMTRTSTAGMTARTSTVGMMRTSIAGMAVRTSTTGVTAVRTSTAGVTARTSTGGMTSETGMITQDADGGHHQGMAITTMGTVSIHLDPSRMGMGGSPVAMALSNLRLLRRGITR